MINLNEVVINIVSSSEFLFVVLLLSFSVKTYFLCILIPQGLRAAKIHKPWLFLLGMIAGSMVGDIAWLVKLCRELWFSALSYGIVTFFIRIAWGFFILQYQSLALFIESLTEKNFKLRAFHKILISIGGSFVLYFFYLAFFDSSLTDEMEREKAQSFDATMPTEIHVMRYVVYYLFNLLLLPSLFFTLRKLHNANLPLILRKQLRIFIQFLLCPYILVELLQAAHFLFPSFAYYSRQIVSISTLLLIYAIYYCIKKVIGLRFLNFNTHVQAHYKANFIDDFKNVLEQLSYTASIQELSHIIQTFFKDAFDVSMRKSMVYIRTETSKDLEASKQPDNKVEAIVENFITTHDPILIEFINQHKVLIYDEIAFSNFYEEDSTTKKIALFLEELNADIFIPIYERQKIIAYIIVERHARRQEFYSRVEHDEMIVFANYLGNILNLLKNRNVETLLHQEKELREELYNNQQEMGQYKESIRSFIRNAQQKEIGILFYKNRRFTFGNQTAKELVQINLNTQEGHPLTQAIKNIAHQVQEYNTPQKSFAKDVQGNKIVLSGVPHLESNNVIITVYYPEISDVLTKHLMHLKDPTKWDYLLYLETTQAGQLINQLIPGSGEMLLHFKINLLKIALSKKTPLLEFPDDDLISTVELLHHISGRETLQTVTVHSDEKNYEIATKLFGVTYQSYPAFSNAASVPLLKKFDHASTLFIKNIDFLTLETQDYLADYIRSGYYRIFKSEQKYPSNARIICSTTRSIQTLVQEGTFSKPLFNLIHGTTITFPAIATLPEQELIDLMDGFAEQAVKTKTFKNLLELTYKEKIKLLLTQPTSLQKLKSRVQNALIQKSKKNQIYEETHFDPAYSITDPELTEAVRLGKHALRDAKIMAMLWNKFKNQNQIANFLGVNRSSVNRRCKDYNLQ